MNKTLNIKAQFHNSLKRGTGEAYLIVKNNPKIDFSNQIIKGALNNYAYDGQSEGNRAQYIFDIISVSNQKSKIRKAILQGLAIEQESTWNLTHLFALTKLFAEQNDIEAKQAIYNRFLDNPIEGSDWVGAFEILELDGLDGLFFISEKYGKYLEKNPDDWQDDLIIKTFQEENKKIKVLEELNKKAKTNKFIQIYLDNIKRTNASQKKYKTKRTKYANIIDETLNSEPYISYKRQKKLIEDEINQLANRLIEEENKTNIEKILYIFEDNKFPFDSQIILNFAKQRRTNKNRIVEFAIHALKNLRSDDIRNFAIEKIQDSKKAINYLEILISNYKSGDFKLLSQIASKTRNEHNIERLAGIFREIFKVNQTIECKEPLEILYDKMNCSICRKDIVEILIKNKVLSDKIRTEIKFDCNIETRKLIKEKNSR